MPNKTVKIEWQRLIIDDGTCPRCGGTEDEIEKAVFHLAKEGITAELIKSEISKGEFDKNPLESNRILINGEAIETLLNAKTGSSCCCDACGDADCRTIEYDNRTYETIPSELIVAAAQAAIEICTLECAEKKKIR